ncbi:MAG: DUF1295 domain-containing protein [Spirochaetaceae bacterium]|nr:MAG: DUF1295 domain-containing protein [Spirochaetaceae bacterium]
MLGGVLPPLAQSDPLPHILSVIALLVLLSFFAGLISGDYSWTDRLWSTAPIGLAWIYAAASRWNGVLVFTAVLVTLWGLRLTFNFARRGGYSGEEDYRWPILKARINQPVLWQLFNLVFIAGYQHFLFICFTIPLYVMYLQSQQTTLCLATQGPLFWVASAAALFFLIIETVADQQQWNFQQRKARVSSDHPDRRRGFCVTGLFRRSRHPNYLGELGVWWSIFAMGAVVIGTPLHWTVAGPVLLTLLFMGSTWFTEGITSSRYPDYKKYQKGTWGIVPRPGRPLSWDGENS